MAPPADILADVTRLLPTLKARMGDSVLSPTVGPAQRFGTVLSTPKRKRIWELAGSLHCSVIGTCLSTIELRRLFGKLQAVGIQSMSDYELHGMGVRLASQRDQGAKLLQKALDQRHERHIKRFDRATSPEELSAVWREAVERGDIPGAYWAVLTHPLSDDQITKAAFGEVHMLSHLVGSANRADIQRLCQLQHEKDELELRLAQAETQFRTEAETYREKIDTLGSAVAALEAKRRGGMADSDAVTSADKHAEADLIDELERRLAKETARRERAEQRLHTLETEVASERQRAEDALERARAIENELVTVEASMAPASEQPEEPFAPQVAGMELLYVGGRASQVAHLNHVARQAGARLLHHDGGMEQGHHLLAGLISRADAVLFPADCVSHQAVGTIKRLCKQAGKPYLPLRSSGVSSFLAALADMPASRPAGAGVVAGPLVPAEAGTQAGR